MVRSGLLALVLAAVLCAPGPALAQENAKVEGARSFIADLGDRTIAVLKGGNSSDEERMLALGEILIAGVNFELLGRFALGRQGRRAKGSGFEEYVQLFAAHIIELATERFIELGVTGYDITKVREMPNGDVIVTTAINHGDGDPFSAGWRVRLRDGRFRINDMLVEGYSVGIHFRNSFERAVDGGLGGITRKLRGKVSDSPAFALAKQRIAIE